ncbi:MAG: hypothetical protein QOE74_4175 [Mycobacterium sp.]|jgi:hypothetical protein|nr:hypothetical protein [Mycobacterium sp.]
MSPDAEATFRRASRTLGNQVIVASDGTPFRQERRPTLVSRTPGAGSGLLTEASTLRAVVVVSWVATVSLSTVESRARRRHTALPYQPPCRGRSGAVGSPNSPSRRR